MQCPVCLCPCLSLTTVGMAHNALDCT